MSTLARYRRMEARFIVGRAPVVGGLAGLLLFGLTQVITPLLPGSLIAFLERAFLIRGLGDVILLNDYLALYTVIFFVGLTQLLGVMVAPREERQLDLLLCKPVPPRRFLSARVGPVLLSTLALGLALSAGCALAVAPYAAASTGGSALGAFGAGALITAAVIGLLGLLNLVFLSITDGFQALITGFVFWVLPLMPTSVYLYRPDLFEGRAALTSALVSPANLIWHDAVMPLVAALGLLVAGLSAMGLLAAAGRRLVRVG